MKSRKVKSKHDTSSSEDENDDDDIEEIKQIEKVKPKIDYKFVQHIAIDEYNLKEPLLGDQSTVDDLKVIVDPYQIFYGDFFYIETDKKVYYPGETIEISVHLRVSEPIERAESLVIVVKGNESMKLISKVKNIKSL